MVVEVKNNFDAKNMTSFKVSGLIKNAYFPKSIEELTDLLKGLENPIVLGNCSNVLISSYGYDGDVIFTSKCNNININGTKIYAECGVKGPMFSQTALKNSLTGFEFMIGFPGSVGGEIYMNASAQGQAISDFLVCADIFDKNSNKILRLTKEQLKFGYRTSTCQEKNYTVLSAEFEAKKGNETEIKTKMEDNLHFRRTHQPSLALPNCGSVFKNPPNNSAGRLLDETGAKSFSVGGAKIWENHANFIINYNNASSEDILNLMLLMYNKVEENFGIKLKPEVIYIGNKSQEEEKIWKILKQN